MYATSGPELGAYGLRLRGLGGPLLVPADSSWPALELVRRIGEARHRSDELSDSSAAVVFQNGGEVELVRNPPRATFTVPFELRDEELVHPYLAPVAAIFSRWTGREAFHGGGVVVDGDRAWAVLADREGGKSSLLAWLALQGHGIVSDDVLVTDGELAYAGPRAIDLRAEAARRLEAGEHLGVVGARERWRVTLALTASAATLQGWIFLAWGSDVRMTRLPAQERLQRLADAQAVLRPPDAGMLLRLSALPAFELQRPRDWGKLRETEVCLLEGLAAAPARPHG